MNHAAGVNPDGKQNIDSSEEHREQDFFTSTIVSVTASVTGPETTNSNSITALSKPQKALFNGTLE